jgi:hypothetical protein
VDRLGFASGADNTVAELLPEICLARGYCGALIIFVDGDISISDLSVHMTASETRAVATDNRARAKFQPYWRRFGMGAILIRWLILRALRRALKQKPQAGPRCPVDARI